MKILIPEEVDFKISTTDLFVEYKERNSAKIKLESFLLEDFKQKEKRTTIQIEFKLVAELKCISLNFQESNYENFEILDINEENVSEYEFWVINGYHPSSGFYQIDDSHWLKESKERYDPRNRLNLKHYLIEGYDSYVELLASNYVIN
ncbi:hypothetical protein AAG747_19370 [Rapidithrix thailandica]|uniref:Uncharacterized protein n=1 Tax=Rapidithrix thailandica TaxID=413964 RepID=A0AAW9S4G7_9BACT